MTNRTGLIFSLILAASMVAKPAALPLETGQAEAHHTKNKKNKAKRHRPDRNRYIVKFNYQAANAGAKGDIDKHLSPGDVVLSYKLRRLYLLLAGGHAISFPTATPRDRKQWRPDGETVNILYSVKNPPWRKPDSLWDRKTPRTIRGGIASNPLKAYKFVLDGKAGANAILIHGRKAWSIGFAATAGCIGLTPRHVIYLASLIQAKYKYGALGATRVRFHHGRIAGVGKRVSVFSKAAVEAVSLKSLGKQYLADQAQIAPVQATMSLRPF